MPLHFEELKQMFREQEEDELNEKKQYELLKREKLKADTEAKKIQNQIYYEKLKAEKLKVDTTNKKNDKIFFITIFTLILFSLLPIVILLLLLTNNF